MMLFISRKLEQMFVFVKNIMCFYTTLVVNLFKSNFVLRLNFLILFDAKELEKFLTSNSNVVSYEILVYFLIIFLFILFVILIIRIYLFGYFKKLQKVASVDGILYSTLFVRVFEVRASKRVKANTTAFGTLLYKQFYIKYITPFAQYWLTHLNGSPYVYGIFVIFVACYNICRIFLAGTSRIYRSLKNLYYTFFYIRQLLLETAAYCYSIIFRFARFADLGWFTRFMFFGFIIFFCFPYFWLMLKQLYWWWEHDNLLHKTIYKEVKYAVVMFLFTYVFVPIATCFVYMDIISYWLGENFYNLVQAKEEYFLATGWHEVEDDIIEYFWSVVGEIYCFFGFYVFDYILTFVPEPNWLTLKIVWIGYWIFFKFFSFEFFFRAYNYVCVKLVNDFFAYTHLPPEWFQSADYSWSTVVIGWLVIRWSIRKYAPFLLRRFVYTPMRFLGLFGSRLLYFYGTKFFNRYHHWSNRSTNKLTQKEKTILTLVYDFFLSKKYLPNRALGSTTLLALDEHDENRVLKKLEKANEVFYFERLHYLLQKINLVSTVMSRHSLISLGLLEKKRLGKTRDVSMSPGLYTFKKFKRKQFELQQKNRVLRLCQSAYHKKIRSEVDKKSTFYYRFRRRFFSNFKALAKADVGESSWLNDSGYILNPYVRAALKYKQNKVSLYVSMMRARILYKVIYRQAAKKRYLLLLNHSIKRQNGIFNAKGIFMRLDFGYGIRDTFFSMDRHYPHSSWLDYNKIDFPHQEKAFPIFNVRKAFKKISGTRRIYGLYQFKRLAKRNGLFRFHFRYPFVKKKKRFLFAEGLHALVLKKLKKNPLYVLEKTVKEQNIWIARDYAGAFSLSNSFLSVTEFYPYVKARSGKFALYRKQKYTTLDILQQLTLYHKALLQKSFYFSSYAMYYMTFAIQLHFYFVDHFDLIIRFFKQHKKLTVYDMKFLPWMRRKLVKQVLKLIPRVKGFFTSLGFAVDEKVDSWEASLLNEKIYYDPGLPEDASEYEKKEYEFKLFKEGRVKSRLGSRFGTFLQTVLLYPYNLLKVFGYFFLFWASRAKEVNITLVLKNFLRNGYNFLFICSSPERLLKFLLKDEKVSPSIFYQMRVVFLGLYKTIVSQDYVPTVFEIPKRKLRLTKRIYTKEELLITKRFHDLAITPLEKKHQLVVGLLNQIDVYEKDLKKFESNFLNFGHRFSFYYLINKIKMFNLYFLVDFYIELLKIPLKNKMPLQEKLGDILEFLTDMANYVREKVYKDKGKLNIFIYSSIEHFVIRRGVLKNLGLKKAFSRYQQDFKYLFKEVYFGWLTRIIRAIYKPILARWRYFYQRPGSPDVYYMRWLLKIWLFFDRWETRFKKYFIHIPFFYIKKVFFFFFGDYVEYGKEKFIIFRDDYFYPSILPYSLDAIGFIRLRVLNFFLNRFLFGLRAVEIVDVLFWRYYFIFTIWFLKSIVFYSVAWRKIRLIKKTFDSIVTVAVEALDEIFVFDFMSIMLSRKLKKFKTLKFKKTKWSYVSRLIDLKNQVFYRFLPQLFYNNAFVFWSGFWFANSKEVEIDNHQKLFLWYLFFVDKLRYKLSPTVFFLRNSRSILGSCLRFCLEFGYLLYFVLVAVGVYLAVDVIDLSAAQYTSYFAGLAIAYPYFNRFWVIAVFAYDFSTRFKWLRRGHYYWFYTDEVLREDELTEQDNDGYVAIFFSLCYYSCSWTLEELYEWWIFELRSRRILNYHEEVLDVNWWELMDSWWIETSGWGSDEIRESSYTLMMFVGTWAGLIFYLWYMLYVFFYNIEALHNIKIEVGVTKNSKFWLGGYDARNFSVVDRALEQRIDVGTLPRTVPGYLATGMAPAILDVTLSLHSRENWWKNVYEGLSYLYVMGLPSYKGLSNIYGAIQMFGSDDKPLYEKFPTAPDPFEIKYQRQKRGIRGIKVPTKWVPGYGRRAMWLNGNERPTPRWIMRNVIFHLHTALQEQVDNKGTLSPIRTTWLDYAFLHSHIGSDKSQFVNAGVRFLDWQTVWRRDMAYSTEGDMENFWWEAPRTRVYRLNRFALNFEWIDIWPEFSPLYDFGYFKKIMDFGFDQDLRYKNWNNPWGDEIYKKFFNVFGDVREWPLYGEYFNNQPTSIYNWIYAPRAEVAGFLKQRQRQLNDWAHSYERRNGVYRFLQVTQFLHPETLYAVDTNHSNFYLGYAGHVYNLEKDVFYANGEFSIIELHHVLREIDGVDSTRKEGLQSMPVVHDAERYHYQGLNDWIYTHFVFPEYSLELPTYLQQIGVGEYDKYARPVVTSEFPHKFRGRVARLPKAFREPWFPMYASINYSHHVGIGPIRPYCDGETLDWHDDFQLNIDRRKHVFTNIPEDRSYITVTEGSKSPAAVHILYVYEPGAIWDNWSTIPASEWDYTYLPKDEFFEHLHMFDYGEQFDALTYTDSDTGNDLHLEEQRFRKWWYRIN